MISGYNHLTQQQENKWIFNAAGSSWQVWEKPDGCNFIHIVVIGAGSGGGGGYQRVATAAAGGGGGGAFAGFYTMMIPAYTIPDKLHIQVGIGGAGGANLTQGSAGTTTYVSLVPNTTNLSANVLISQNYGFSSFGQPGSATGGAGGTGSGASGITWALNFTGWGKTVQILSAGNGQAGLIGTNLEQIRILGSGAGGQQAAASTEAAGRSVISLYKQPSTVVYSQGEPLGVSGKAGNGPNLLSPQLQFFGGASGAALITTNTVNGGDGGIGCGGGGAGPNLTGGSSTGGKGGDGMVIITCW